MRSRRTSSVHGSPNTSSAKWTGQSDLRCRRLIGGLRALAFCKYLWRMGLRIASPIVGLLAGLRASLEDRLQPVEILTSRTPHCRGHERGKKLGKACGLTAVAK